MTTRPLDGYACRPANALLADLLRAVHPEHRLALPNGQEPTRGLCRTNIDGLSEDAAPLLTLATAAGCSQEEVERLMYRDATTVYLAPWLDASHRAFLVDSARPDLVFAALVSWRRNAEAIEAVYAHGGVEALRSYVAAEVRARAVR